MWVFILDNQFWTWLLSFIKIWSILHNRECAYYIYTTGMILIMDIYNYCGDFSIILVEYFCGNCHQLWHQSEFILLKELEHVFVDWKFHVYSSSNILNNFRLTLAQLRLLDTCCRLILVIYLIETCGDWIGTWWRLDGDLTVTWYKLVRVLLETWQRLGTVLLETW